MHDLLHTVGGPLVTGLTVTLLSSIAATGLAMVWLTWQNRRLLLGEDDDLGDTGLVGEVRNLRKDLRRLERVLVAEGYVDPERRADGGEEWRDDREQRGEP